MYKEHRCHGDRMHGHWNRGKYGHPHGRKFAHHFGDFFGQSFRRVPANIEETDQEFIIHLFVPNLIKEHLKVSTKDDVLTVNYTPDEAKETERKFSRREYSNGSFERAFALNGKVLTDHISAAYADGILKVTLPKNPETNIPAKNIAVN